MSIPGVYTIYIFFVSQRNKATSSSSEPEIFAIQRMSLRIRECEIGRGRQYRFFELKGKSCNTGNSENYINAGNRKVYTMIELHGVASVCWPTANRLHVGVSNSFCQLREASSCTGSFYILPKRIFGRLYFSNLTNAHAKWEMCLRDFFSESTTPLPSPRTSAERESRTNFSSISHERMNGRTSVGKKTAINIPHFFR